MKKLTTYDMCKKIIKENNYENNDMLMKLDIFLMGNRISSEEYKELSEMINQEENQ